MKPPAPLLPTPPPHAAAAGARSRTRVSLQLAARQPGMERVAGGGGGGAGEARGADAPPPPPVAAGGGGGAVKGKSCKGYLFYSSSLRSRDRGPVCAGITRAIPQVPDHMVGEIEMEAIQEGRNLSDFRYGCIGYSMYLDDKKSSEGKGDKHPQLPICVGIELPNHGDISLHREETIS